MNQQLRSAPFALKFDTGTRTASIHAISFSTASIQAISFSTKENITVQPGDSLLQWMLILACNGSWAEDVLCKFLPHVQIFGWTSYALGGLIVSLTLTACPGKLSQSTLSLSCLWLEVGAWDSRSPRKANFDLELASCSQQWSEQSDELTCSAVIIPFAKSQTHLLHLHSVTLALRSQEQRDKNRVGTSCGAIMMGRR